MSSVGSLLSGTPASVGPAIAAAQGAATIALGAQEAAVANTAVRASTVAVAWIAQDPADGTLKVVGVRVDPGVGLVLTGDAASTAAVTCGWAILKY